MSKFFFQKKLAKIYGVNEAIVLEYIHFFSTKNVGSKKHYHDGKYWTYGSVNVISKHFPFWSERQVWRILKSLEQHGAIDVGSFNRKAYDRTKWYTISDKCRPFYQTVKPIPVVNNNNNNLIIKHKPI
jgi:hypothetical protein